MGYDRVMARTFNTAGPCRPEDHYMLPPEPRLPEVRGLIGEKQYFVLHAPRQSGKTTLFRSLARALTEEGHYVALHMSCESAQTARSDVERGIQAVLHAIEHQAVLLPEDLRPAPLSTMPEIGAESRLSAYLSRWCELSPRPVVLFLDEIDALLDDSLISVLRQLRAGYADRPTRFPHSTILIGLRDVRDYKVQIRPDTATLGTSSPFNIKAESLTLENFSAEDVAALYRQHSEETGQSFTDEALSRAHELTRGQPWLVNALARQIVRNTVPDPVTTIEARHVDEAAEILIRRRDTHLDSLIDKLREPRVERVISPILAGELVLGDRLNDDIAYVEDLGLVDRSGGHLRIANPIYHEVIPRALASGTQYTIYHETQWYVGDDGRLDMPALLKGFLEFWCRHGEALMGSQPYKEVAFQLVVMSFLQRIINGGGSILREYAIGRGRMDLCVCWPTPTGEQQQEVLELKVWRDGQADPLRAGLKQLARYLTRLGLDHGALLIFDRRAEAPSIEERAELDELEHEGRRATVLRL